MTLLSYALPQDRDGVARLATQMSVRAVEWTAPSANGQTCRAGADDRVAASVLLPGIHSEHMQQAIDDVCSTEGFDVIQLESSFLCTFRFPGDTRLVIDEHNIEYEVFQRMCAGERSLPRRAFNRLEYLRCRRFEQAGGSGPMPAS